MAQGDSAVSICNAALVALGSDLISSLTDATKRAALCNLRYDPVRRMVLRMRPWSCAKKQVQLAASTTPPPFGRQNQFPLPADFIRLWDEYVDDPYASDDGFELIGNAVQSDDGGPFDLIYVYDLQDTTQMDALLVQCIALALAADIAPALTGSKEKQADAQAMLNAILPDASLVTSQENSPKEWDEDVWLRARDF